MPRFQTNLLIRDKRLQRFESTGAKLGWRKLSDAEFDTELRRKLVEEANEAATAEVADLKRELGDVFEVLVALGKNNGLSLEDIRAQAEARLAELGGFEQRIYSEWVEAPESHETVAYHRKYPDKYPEIG